MALLEGVDRRLTDALAVLDRDGALAVRELEQAVHGLSDHSAISEAMADIQVRLAALIPQAETEPPASDLYPVLRRAYTMEGERRIHDTMLGTIATTAPADEAPAAADDDFLLF